MSRFGKTLLFSAAVLVVLGAGVWILTILPSGEPAVEVPPSPSAQEEVLTVAGMEDVASVTFTPADGPAFTIVKTGTECAMQNPTDTLPYNETRMYDALITAVTPTGATLLKKDVTAGEMSAFGFDRPAVGWRVSRTDGSFVSLELGALTATGENYYARVKGENSVYLISKSSGDALMRAETDYYDLTFTRKYTIEGTTKAFPDLMQHMLLAKSDGSRLEFRARSEEEMGDLMTGMSLWAMVQPFAGDTGENRVREEIAGAIASIAPSSVAAQNAADLAPFGLDSPDVLTVEDMQGWKAVLLIGGRDKETGGRYVMLEGSSSVLLDTAGDYGFLTVDPVTLRSSLIWLYNINDVVSVDMDFSGERHTLEVDNSGGEFHFARLNGVDLSEDNAKNLYMRVLNVLVDGHSDDPPFGELFASVTIGMRDGIQHVMRLLRMDDRRFFIEIDGVCDGFYANIRTIRNLQEGARAVARGETIHN